MCLFGNKKISISDLGDSNKQVLLMCLDLVITNGMGAQYKGLDAALKTDKLTKKQMKECISVAELFRSLVVSQPELANAFGSLNFDATVRILQNTIAYFEKKI